MIPRPRWGLTMNKQIDKFSLLDNYFILIATRFFHLRMYSHLSNLSSNRFQRPHTEYLHGVVILLFTFIAWKVLKMLHCFMHESPSDEDERILFFWNVNFSFKLFPWNHICRKKEEIHMLQTRKITFPGKNTCGYYLLWRARRFLIFNVSSFFSGVFYLQFLNYFYLA